VVSTLLSILLLVADIWAIYNIFTSNEKPVNKLVWTLVVVLLPLIGLIIWYFAGPKASAG
jgi:hypothetical protein